MRTSARVLGLSALACSSLSCLVTDEIKFGEPNYPAFLARVSPKEFGWVPFENDPLCGSENSDTDAEVVQDKMMRFEVQVSDVNVYDDLIARVVVKTSRGTDTVGRGVIGSTGKVQRGNHFICVSHAALAAKCNYVVFAVSRDFAESDDDLEVKEPGDLGTASFFVLGVSEDNSIAQPEDCEQLLADGGVP